LAEDEKDCGGPIFAIAMKTININYRLKFIMLLRIIHEEKK
jgi:hypothetical protein